MEISTRFVVILAIFVLLPVFKHFLIPFNYLNLRRSSVPLHGNHRYFLFHLCRLRVTSYIHSLAGQNSKLQPFS